MGFRCDLDIVPWMSLLVSVGFFNFIFFKKKKGSIEVFHHKKLSFDHVHLSLTKPEGAETQRGCGFGNKYELLFILGTCRSPKKASSDRESPGTPAEVTAGLWGRLKCGYYVSWQCLLSYGNSPFFFFSPFDYYIFFFLSIQVAFCSL